MKQRASFFSGEDVAVGGIALRVIWDVRADSAYEYGEESIRETAKSFPDNFVAIRTLRGMGEVCLRHAGAVDTPPDSLLFAQFKDLLGYRCKHDQWDFWWFQFSISGPMHFPLGRVILAPPDPDDEKDFLTVFETVRHPTFLRRCYSTATFQRMLYRWTMDWEGLQLKGPHRKTLLGIIQKMHDKLTRNWSVPEMAAEARMSEGYFRDVFQELTGQTPRKFYESLRLSMAEELLRRGGYNVSQTADYLDYSSPFHFSKAFRRHFGVPPSRRS